MAYVARSHGRGAAELLLLLRKRLANPPAVEVRLAAAEQMEITRARLLHVLGTARLAQDRGVHEMRVPMAAT